MRLFIKINPVFLAWRYIVNLLRKTANGYRITVASDESWGWGAFVYKNKKPILSHGCI